MERCRTCGVAPCLGKRVAELVGRKGAEAKEIIERENLYVKVWCIPCSAKRILNCCCNRVSIFVATEAVGEYGEARVCWIQGWVDSFRGADARQGQVLRVCDDAKYQLNKEEFILNMKEMALYGVNIRDDLVL